MGENRRKSAKIDEIPPKISPKRPRRVRPRPLKPLLQALDHHPLHPYLQVVAPDADMTQPRGEVLPKRPSSRRFEPWFHRFLGPASHQIVLERGLDGLEVAQSAPRDGRTYGTVAPSPPGAFHSSSRPVFRGLVVAHEAEVEVEHQGPAEGAHSEVVEAVADGHLNGFFINKRHALEAIRYLSWMSNMAFSFNRCQTGSRCVPAAPRDRRSPSSQTHPSSST